MYLLPPPPEGCRTLTNQESEHLTRTHSGLHTLDGCVTCSGRHSIRWWNYYVTDDEKSRQEGVLRNFDDFIPTSAPAASVKPAPEVVEYECRIDGYTESGVECGCVGQWIMYRYFLHCGIGLQYQRLGWEDYQGPASNVDAIKEWKKHYEWNVRSGIGLVLRGGYGTGKTLLSTLLLKDLVANVGLNGMMVGFAQMISAMTAGWSSAEDRIWFVKRVKNADVLLIDDIGREFQSTKLDKSGQSRVSTDLAQAALDEVLRHRLSNSKVTFVTTNLSWEQLHTYGPNVMSLLQERTQTLHFEGDDFRASKAAERTELEKNLNLHRPVVVG